MTNEVHIEAITVLDSPHIRYTVTSDLRGEIEIPEIGSGRWTSASLDRNQLVELGEGALTAAAIIDRRRADKQRHREL